MKNSFSLVCRIICSAFFISFLFHTASAQPGTTAKTAAEWVWADEDIYRKQLKNDGIPAITIEKLVTKRKELIFQGRQTTPFAQPVKLFGQNPVTQALCSDMGGETGWGGWVSRPGTCNNCVLSWGAPTTPTAPRFNLTSGPGTDPCTPGPAPGAPTVPVVAPGFGNASIQIGQPQTNGAFIEELSYPLTVGINDTNFTFGYAIVIEDPSHVGCDQPYVSLCIYDSNGNSIGSCGCFTYTAGPALPGFFQSACNVNSISYYKDWTLVGINLSAYIGQTLTVVIQNADCSLTGHFAHSYWDFSCGTLSSVYQYCIGEDSLMMVAPSTGTGYTYSWSPGGSTNDSILVNPQLIDTVILYTTPPSGCGFYSVFILAPTIINTALTYSVNCNQVTFSDSTTISGGTISGWNWQFPGGSPATYTLSGTPPPVTYPVGTYTASLTVTSQAGCTDTTAYVSFTINPPPVITATSASICGSNTATICASGGVTYLWSPSSATTSCIVVSTSSAPSYTVVGTDSGGCTNTAVATVLTNAPPTITAGPNSSLCAVNPPFCPTLTAVISGTSPYTYVWSPATGLSNPNISNPVACPSVTTIYTVTGTDANNCSNTTTVSVTALPGPTVSATSTPAGCTALIGTATANPSGGPAPYTYSWSNGQTNQTATGLATGNYNVIVTNGNGCTGIASVSVQVTPDPVVTANSPSTICFGQTTAVISASSNPGGVSYAWSPSAGLSCATCQTTTANPTSTNTYFVTVTDVNGCTNTASVPIIVGAIPYLSAIASPTVCTGGTVILNANVSNVPASQYPVQWNWYPPNSPPLNSDTLEDPTITPNTTTNLYVVVTDLYGCKDTAYATVYVETIPSVSWTEWTPYITCEGYVIPLFANISSNGGSAYWDFGDNSNFTDYQPAPGGMIWTSGPTPHIYNFGSTYSVSVVAINSICRDTIDTTFTINDMGQYLNVLPANVFTPNGDGLNECFRPALDIQNVPNITNPDSLMATLVQCITLEVWDRWGIEIFKSDDNVKCWDGKTRHGTPAKAGTYYYIAMFKDVVIKGFVELLR